MSVGTHAEGVLIVDDEARIRSILQTILADEGYSVETAASGKEALQCITRFRPHICIVDLQMPHMDGMETIARIREIVPEVVPIILTAHGSIQSAVEAIKSGVYDYLTKPFDNVQLLLVVQRALALSKLHREVQELKSALSKTQGIAAILGASSVMERLRSTILRVAETDATVLIQGETGSGKELVARAIHYESPRSRSSFVVVDCTSIPASLIESEFFGHEKGAFTDAGEQRRGKFEEAHTGTVFLDEIGELPLGAQTRLLRVLQEKEFTRVGGTSLVKVDVRVLAATNRDLEALVAKGEFREDLFYRLNVLTVRVPSLREHRGDIQAYVHHFIEKYATAADRTPTGITPEALAGLLDRPWKGNIRELENVVRRAMVSAQGREICADDLQIPPLGLSPPADEGLEVAVRRLAEETERRLILTALEDTGWNRTAAATRLKISRKTLFNKMQLYGLAPNDQ